jgi:hypothetical protein
LETQLFSPISRIALATVFLHAVSLSGEFRIS